MSELITAVSENSWISSFCAGLICMDEEPYKSVILDYRYDLLLVYHAIF